LYHSDNRYGILFFPFLTAFVHNASSQWLE